MPQNNPPLRADIVGSLLRPQVLIDGRRSYRERAIGREELVQIEDAAIREVVALQEAVGLKVVTDGEFRRQNYIIDFYFKVFGRGGLAFEPGLFFHRNDKGEKLPAELGVGGCCIPWPPEGGSWRRTARPPNTLSTWRSCFWPQNPTKMGSSRVRAWQGRQHRHCPETWRCCPGFGGLAPPHPLGMLPPPGVATCQTASMSTVPLPSLRCQL